MEEDDFYARVDYLYASIEKKKWLANQKAQPSIEKKKKRPAAKPRPAMVPRFFPNRQACLEMSEDDFYCKVNLLYGEIEQKIRIQPLVQSAIHLPSGDNIMESYFDVSIHKAAQLINQKMYSAHVSVRYEGGKRWTLLGSTDADFIEFQLFKHSRANSPCLRVTGNLSNLGFFECHLQKTEEEYLTDRILGALKVIHCSRIPPKSSN